MNWADSFTKATKAILDAFSHVDEFDCHTFMASIFDSTQDPFKDANAKIASEHARAFIKQANILIQSMLNFHPADEESNTPMSWWKEDKYYQFSCRLLNTLQAWTDVLPRLQDSIDALSGIHYKSARLVLSTFKKECENALYGLNKIINNYNREVAEKYPDYKLIPINY
jgi:hypothetical protein